MLRIISLGAGVQSSTMALMAAHGEIGPMPDCAIFADTGWEPKAVYKHLEWLKTVLPFQVHVVSAGNIVANMRLAAQGKRWASIPAFTEGSDGRAAPMRRQCTKEYKLVPIRRKVREIAGLTRKRSPLEPVVEQWIGISFDEAIRAKPSREAWQCNRFPLLERETTRRHCLSWMERHGYPTPPKSSCIGCPYHDDKLWLDMKTKQPEEFAEAVEMDHLIRTGTQSVRGELFLHRSLLPLDQVEFRPKTEKVERQFELDLFLNECEGMCGV